MLDDLRQARIKFKKDVNEFKIDQPTTACGYPYRLCACYDSELVGIELEMNLISLTNQTSLGRESGEQARFRVSSNVKLPDEGSLSATPALLQGMPHQSLLPV